MLDTFRPAGRTNSITPGSGLRELHHAFEGGKEVYVVWACRGIPSPFITETATRVFKSTDEALDYFRQKGYVK